MDRVSKAPPLPRRRDFGRLVAQALCAILALVGSLPFVAGFLVRSPPVLAWAASETARVLHEQLGVEAEYDVEVRLWPLQVALLDVRVPASDGGSPAFTAERMSVSPQVFSLLAGRLDVGDIEVDAPRGRVVVQDGVITNVRYRLPSRDGGPRPLDRAPFAALAITDGRFQVDLDGVRIDSGMTDIDVFTDKGASFEVALRASLATVNRKRPLFPPPLPRGTPPPPEGEKFGTAVDEDVLCRIDARVRIERGAVLVRRLSALGFADSDPASHTRPSCANIDEDAENRVALRLSQVRIVPQEGRSPQVAGHVVARGPVGAVNRFVRAHELRGWAGIVADFRYDGHSRLPEMRGKVRGAGLEYWRYSPARRLEVEFDVRGDRVRLPHFEVAMADGSFVGRNAEVAPFEPGAPLRIAEVESHDVEFSGLMRDLGVAAHTVVDWDIQYSKYSNVTGTLHPLDFGGKLHARTGRFAVYDAGFDDPRRHHMIGVASSVLDGTLAFTPKAAEFQDVTARFGNSIIHSPVISIGFHNTVRVEVDQARLELADISPITTIPWAGRAELSMEMAGISRNPILTGNLAIRDFNFGGFPLGDVQRTQVRFQPLKVDLTDLHGIKGDSGFVIPTARLDFNRRGALIIDAVINSQRTHLKDFFHMFHFDQDPRFTPIQGEGTLAARVHYDIGGPLDKCGLGYLRVQGESEIAKADLYEELYDGGQAKFDFEWFDQAANYLGANLDVPSFTLKKGTGTILGALRMRRGAKLDGNVVATGLPLSAVQSMGDLGELLDARASAVGTVSGSIDRLAFQSQVTLTPVRVGTATLPESELLVRLEPLDKPIPRAGVTQCGLPVPAAFDRAAYDRDPSEGTYIVDGDLFGGQIQIDDVKLSRQRFKSMTGTFVFDELDLGALAQLSPELAAVEPKPRGQLSAKLAIEHMKLVDPANGQARVDLEALDVGWGGAQMRLEPGAKPVVLAAGALQAPGLALGVAATAGPKAVFDVSGRLSQLTAQPQIDGRLDLRPIQLGALAPVIPNVDRASGVLTGGLRVSGAASDPAYTGGFTLEKGELAVHGLPSPVTDLGIQVKLEQGELRLERAAAKLGSGTVQVTGSAPLRGLEVGRARGVIQVRSLALPLVDGVEAAVDADLVATYLPATADGEVTLPRITGSVAVRSFEYARPITMSADIASLTQRGKRTTVDAYNPDDDMVELDIKLRSARPLVISNNLAEAQLELPDEGLRIAGTNQRFGATGTVKMVKGGRIRLRQNEFEIQQGQVRFEDPTRIAPLVDVTATTEYRRYDQAAGSEAAGRGASASSASQAAAGGRWLVTLHAYGDTEELKVDLTSQPALAQDDIFLLLTVGLTRAELDQAKRGVGGSVALEALGTLTGADQAVREVVPVIDEFRFGSAYSSRTGRTEPTVTIGKRLAERIRANVTSGLSESREVRSNVELSLNPRMSAEASYDNVNDISSSSLGNLGGDIRWRLEFGGE